MSIPNHYGMTGTRSGMTKDQKKVFFDILHDGHTIDRSRPWYFHHGGAPGADLQGHKMVRIFDKKCKIQMHPATSKVRTPPEWYDVRDECHTVYKALPPLERNRLIVAGANLGLFAFPAQDDEITRSGTWATIRYAREIGRPITIIFPRGSIAFEPSPWPIPKSN